MERHLVRRSAVVAKSGTGPYMRHPVDRATVVFFRRKPVEYAFQRSCRYVDNSVRSSKNAT